MSEEKRPFERLPSDVVPVNYKLELRPDLAKFTFQGKLDIKAKVGQPTRSMAGLHFNSCHDLSLSGD